MILKTSPAGKGFVTFMEGRRTIPYRDSGGKWTCGIGHLMAEGDDTDGQWSDEKVAATFAMDLLGKEMAVNDLGVPLNQLQFDALVSLAFNIGAYAFKTSTVARDLLKLRYHQAADAILLWESHGVLRDRRAAERGLFLYGCTP